MASNLATIRVELIANAQKFKTNVDKLINVSPEIKDLAKEKFNSVNEAYNVIKKSKISDNVSRFLYSSPSAKTHVLTRTPEFCNS